MESDRTPAPLWRRMIRRLPHVLILTVAAAATTAQAGDARWVRIHHSADDPAVHAVTRDSNLVDYGAFQWGRIDSKSIATLRGSGVRVSEVSRPFHLTLGGQTFDPLTLRSTQSLRQPDRLGDFHIVQFDGPVRARWVENLRATGARVVQALHPFSYIVWADADAIADVRSLSRVRWTGLLRKDWKVQPRLRDLDSAPRQTMALASAYTGPGELQERLGDFGRVLGISPMGRDLLVVHMEVPGSDYLALGDLPFIYTVQYIPPETGPRGEMSNQSVVGNIDGSGNVVPGYASWLTDTGYDGSGVTVGVVDGRVRASHDDLADRMRPCTGTNGSCGSAPNSDHGTHVAGAIAGTGATGTLLDGFLRGQGVAPGAGIVSQIYGPFTDSSGPGAMVPDGMLQIYQDSARSGALLTNNSWGPTVSPQGYDIPTRQIDMITRDADPDTPGNQPVLPVWSIMNGNGDDSGACAPSSLGSPDEAKNLFAVGSTALQNGDGDQLANIFRVSTNSGHGPACDGRRVPHIVAPGCSTDSASSSSDTAHTFKCGTSMASPVVSGSVALWWEKYRDANGGADPSPALVKAVFTAAARNLEGNPNADGDTMGHRPDRFQGYGRLDLDAVMNPGVDVYLYDQQTVFDNTGQQWSLSFVPADPSRPVRIMLAWTDAPGPGIGGTTPAWVNNLDLDVATAGQTYLGNVIGSDGWSASGGSADISNNLEGVFLSPSQTGSAFEITVSATDLAGDALDPHGSGDSPPRQDFALACYNCTIGDPTFSIATSPGTLEACIPESGASDYDVAVDVGAIGNYTGSVNLSASGEPSGVTSALSPASVAVPGTSTWTVTVTDSASPGTSSVAIDGDDGTEQNSADLALVLDAFLASGPALQAPADGASDLILRPTFAWSALTGAEDYRIQVATDSGFNDLVVDQTVSAANFTPASDFALDTEYFWRVRGNNLCGGGAWSSTRGFTTRLEPQLQLSQQGFAIELAVGLTTDETLTIANTGTGNLTWDLSTDQLAGASMNRGAYDPALDETLAVADFTLPGGATVNDSAEAGLATAGEVVGFTFEGTVAGIGAVSTWASDMAMTLTAPDSTAFTVGGYQTNNPDWAFQGSGSDSDGTYTSTHIGDDVFGAEGVADAGIWDFSFEHTYNDTMEWSAVSVTLHKQPPPFCEEPLDSVDWLDVSATSGRVGEGGSEDVTLSVDTSGLSAGQYTAYLCLTTNDPGSSLVAVPVELEVTIGIFGDRFETDPAEN